MLEAVGDGSKELAIQVIKIVFKQVGLGIHKKALPKQMVKKDHSALKPNLLHLRYKTHQNPPTKILLTPQI